MTDDDNNKPMTIVVPSQGVVGVATDTIGALKGSPLLIVMVVLNCAFIAAASFYLTKQQDHFGVIIGKVFDRCLPDVHPEAHIVPSPPKPFKPTDESYPQQ